jgi:hypothetical protein
MTAVLIRLWENERRVSSNQEQVVSLPKSGIKAMNKYLIRNRIISYVSPYIRLFPTNYALVFGTRHGVGKFAGDILYLHDRGYFENLIISGGVTVQGAPSEAELILQAVVKCGIPKDIIVLEDKATNTGENVIFARDKLNGHAIEEILLIGKISSKRRYVMTVKKHWPEIRKICCHGVNYFSCGENQWWKDEEFRRRVISECRRIPSYIDKDFISEISIVDGIVIDDVPRLG